MTPVPALLCLLLALPARSASFESRVIARLTIDDRGDSAEGAELRAGLRRMLKSPTARGLAGGLLSRPGKIIVRFTDNLGGRSESFDGDRWLDGTNATTKREGAEQTVNVDARLRDPRLGGFEGFLAHELFGHAVPWLSVRGGPLEKFYGFSAEEELRAELIGGLVDAELGRRLGGIPTDIALSTAPFGEVFAWQFVPEQFLIEDLPRARRACAERLTQASRLGARSVIKLREFGVWRYRIDHLVNAHGYDRRSLADVSESLAFHARDNGSSRKRWDGIASTARGLLADLDRREDRDWIPGLARLGREPFILAQRRDSQGLRARLRSVLTKNPKLLEPAEPAPKPPVVQLDWNEIDVIVARDRAKHPEHYAGEPPLESVEISRR